MGIFKFTRVERNPIIKDNQMTKALRLRMINFGSFNKEPGYSEKITPIYYGIGRVYPNKKNSRFP